MERPKRRPASASVEVLRFFVVILGAGLGYLIGSRIETGELGVPEGVSIPFVGVVVGAGLGYSFGGVIARGTMKAITRTDTSLDKRTPEEVAAGGIGAVAGTLIGGVLALPAFFLPAIIGIPIFAFVVVTGMLLGFRVGLRRRLAVLSATSPATGVATDRSKGNREPLIDSSVAIDGRILDVVDAGFLRGRYLLCQPVIDELQSLADSGDALRRDKGRRGLGVLDDLRRRPGVEVEVIGDEAPGAPDVDAKLIQIALKRGAGLLTLDSALAKAASLAGVDVGNFQQLALALRPRVAVGDRFDLQLNRPGKERRQAVGYLEDGTMVVVEDAVDRLGQDVAVEATSVLVTSNGRLIFARVDQ